MSLALHIFYKDARRLWKEASVTLALLAAVSYMDSRRAANTPGELEWWFSLLLPAAWLGNGDPTWVVAEIALLSLIVIPIVWWIARSVGGPAAGLTAAPALEDRTPLWTPHWASAPISPHSAPATG